MSDWIKMRAGLLTHPKVIRMARFLASDQVFIGWWIGRAPNGSVSESLYETCDVTVVTRVTVGTLLAVWSAVNVAANSEGQIKGISLFEVDEMAGVPSFGEAMRLVGWCEVTDEGVLFPNFHEHNVVGKQRTTEAKSAAQRTREWRERRKILGLDDVTIGDVTVTSPYKAEKSREEKSREDIKDKSKAIAPSRADARSEPAEIGAGEVIAMVPSLKGDVTVRQSFAMELIEAYPDVMVAQEIDRAVLWLRANPAKRKSNVRRFLTNWVSRTQERVR